ncbi:Cytochrome b5-like Heme/Steroid binding domain [Musa troglodytarum]|uniref:Cytochrome b5-like Heme/Steroid binding domain n=1 Tax=Musa troglodytarum TaxID=320322 RepID=A0A9E7EV15_9LILI|nr:Cytochrome b5-like Heme/Steroid binding domain [Musa troglodytarum]
MAGSRIYHFDEVAKHNDAEDCWLIVSGKVPNLAFRDHAVGFKSFCPSSPWLAIVSAFMSMAKCTLHGSFFSMLQVYDVSSYMAEHPGGRDVLLSATGKDATVDFENVGHSSSGRELMDNYCIGTIDSSTLPNDGEGVKAQQAPKGSADKTSEFVMRILQFIAPVMILGLAFVVRHFTK